MHIRIRTLAATVASGAALLAVGVAAGDAASTPAVTRAATSVTSTSAVLNGVINANGQPTFWVFQWGTSKSYGRTTRPQGPITSTSSVDVSLPITGLKPGTTYDFRLVAIQGFGEASGEPQLFGGRNETFTTPKKHHSTSKKHARR